MKNKLLLISSLVSIALLQACGGGGGGSGESASASPTTASEPTTTPASPPAASGNSGSVSAAFVAGSTPRYQLAGSGNQTFGRLEPFVQAPSGAMTTLGSTVLSGDSVTKDIAGDATFAIGRWTAGTVTHSSGAETLTGTDNRAYHYVVVNAPSAFPASGAKTCDAGAFTTPTYVSGGPGAAGAAAAQGSAGLVFGASGAAVTGAINVTVAGASGSATLNGTAASVTSVAITGAYLSGGAGAAVQIGEAGADAYLVVASYVATLPNGARYLGAAKFRCA